MAGHQGRECGGSALKAVKTLRQNDAIQMADIRRHDLRRTAASGMAEAAVVPSIISRVLNHVDRGPRATLVYNRYCYDAEKRAALLKWDGRLSSILMSSQCNVPDERSLRLSTAEGSPLTRRSERQKTRTTGHPYEREHGRLLTLDGPSMRTKHLGLDDATAPGASDQPARISGTDAPEFPEPTPSKESTRYGRPVADGSILARRIGSTRFA